jgi:hypothetical protein
VPAMQMVHSSLTINEAAIDPCRASRRGPQHAHRQLSRGRWQMAFYAVHTTSSGIRHHFIWRGPEEGSPFPCPAGRIPGRTCRDRARSSCGSPPCAAAALILEDWR